MHIYISTCIWQLKLLFLTMQFLLTKWSTSRNVRRSNGKITNTMTAPHSPPSYLWAPNRLLCRRIHRNDSANSLCLQQSKLIPQRLSPRRGNSERRSTSIDLCVGYGKVASVQPSFREPAATSIQADARVNLTSGILNNLPTVMIFGMRPPRRAPATHCFSLPQERAAVGRSTRSLS